MGKRSLVEEENFLSSWKVVAPKVVAVASLLL